MIDHWVVSALFSRFGGESPPPYVEWWLQDEWNHQCEEYNQAYWNWYGTKDQVAANANDVASDIEALADKMETGVQELESVESSCKKVVGKPLCLDFFIMNCTLLLVGEGDCRGFDSDAEFSNSRVQLYLDPESLSFTAKYSCTRFAIPGQPSFPVCDSARVYDPDRDVQIERVGADSFMVSVEFLNNACARIRSVCPAINASIYFARNAAAPGGWHVTFVRDGFPSMGVYSRNAADTGFDTVMEDPQKTRNGLNAMRALAAEIRSQGSNVPPPANPNECIVS